MFKFMHAHTYIHCYCCDLYILQAKNAASRDLVSKASVDGIQVQGLNSKQKFSKQFVAEALIISDLFNVDELAAVELLMAGN